MSSKTQLEDLQQILALGLQTREGHEEDDLTDSQLLTNDLKAALPILEQLRQQHQDDYVTAIKLLADAARNEEWRIPLRQSGILENVIYLWDIKGSPPLSLQVLRLWGNGCIDLDESRDVVAKAGFEKLANALSLPDAIGWDLPVLTAAISALYNVCVDHELAQEKAVQSDLHNILPLLLPSLDWEAGSSIFELTAMLIAKASEMDPTLVNKGMSEKSLTTAFTRTTNVIDSGYILETLVTYCKAHRTLLFDPAASFTIFDKLEQYNRRLDTLPEDAEDELDSGISQLRSATAIVVEVCDSTTYTDPYNGWLESRMIDWIHNFRPYLTECACLVLGNRAFDKPNLEIFDIQRTCLHLPLLKIITGDSALSLKHAAAGFLTALSRTEKNTLVILEEHDADSELAWVVIRSLLFEKDFTLIKDAFVLVRALVQNSIAACRFLLEPDSLPVPSSSESTRLAVITSRCSKMHGDSPFTAAPLAACAQAVTEMTRIMLQPNMTTITEPVYTFLGDAWLLHPLMETLNHTEEEALKLDCTVGLAYIALSSTEGAAIVALAVSAEETGLLRTIENICHSGSASCKANCHIVIAHLLKKARDQCPPSVQETLTSLY